MVVPSVSSCRQGFMDDEETGPTNLGTYYPRLCAAEVGPVVYSMSGICPLKPIHAGRILSLWLDQRG